MICQPFFPVDGAAHSHGSGDTGGVNWHAVAQAALQQPLHVPLGDPGGPVEKSGIIIVGGHGGAPVDAPHIGELHMFDAPAVHEVAHVMHH